MTALIQRRESDGYCTVTGRVKDLLEVCAKAIMVTVPVWLTGLAAGVMLAPLALPFPQLVPSKVATASRMQAYAPRVVLLRRCHSSSALVVKSSKAIPVLLSQ